MVTPEMREAKELEAKGTAMEQIAQQLQIIDNPSYEQAGLMLVQVKEARDRSMEVPEKRKEDANRLHTFMSGICKMVLAPFERTENILDRKMRAYRAEVEQAAAAERKKFEAQSNAEAKKKRDAEIAEAKKLGDKEGAKNLKAAPIVPEYKPPTVIAPPKIKGVPVRKVWDYNIIDENKIPRKFFVLDTATIGKLVRALGANHGIPGVQAFQKEVQ